MTMRNVRFPASLMRAAVLLSGTFAATPSLAQYIGGAPPPLPAAPRAGEVETPSAALARSVRTLAQSPRDFRALIGAGRAALDLGDTQTAIGFFGRAEEVRPSDPAPKIGMGAAMVVTGDARGALGWFFQAQELGASPAAIGADRGLAQDLLGNQAAAQIDYRAALVGPERDEARRRLSLSLGISGKRDAAFSMLQPLLMRQDPAAQRIRAFILALVGDERGASGAIDTAMPGAGARMAGFFRLLPSLSATQKAAAVHLGVFPDPAEIRVAAINPRLIAPSAVSQRTPRLSRSAPRAVTPEAPPSDEPRPRMSTPSFSDRRSVNVEPRASRRARPVKIARGARVAAPTLSPVSAADFAPPVGSATPPQQPAPQPAFTLPVQPQSEAPEPLKFDPPSPPVAAPTISPAPPPATAPAQSALAPAFSSPSSVVPMSGDRLSGIDRLLAQADELPVPTPSRPKVERPAKVTDVAKSRKAAELKAVQAKAADAKKLAERKQAADDKAAREAIGLSGTHWVQLAGGANANRMGIEFKRFAAKSSTLKKRGGAVTGGKDYFRLLTGPFASKSEAQAFVNQLARDGVDGFSWNRAPATLRIEKLAPK